MLTFDALLYDHWDQVTRLFREPFGSLATPAAACCDRNKTDCNSCTWKAFWANWINIEEILFVIYHMRQYCCCFFTINAKRSKRKWFSSFSFSFFSYSILHRIRLIEQKRPLSCAAAERRAENDFCATRTTTTTTTTTRNGMEWKGWLRIQLTLCPVTIDDKWLDYRMSEGKWRKKKLTGKHSFWSCSLVDWFRWWWRLDRKLSSSPSIDRILILSDTATATATAATNSSWHPLRYAFWPRAAEWIVYN